MYPCDPINGSDYSGMFSLPGFITGPVAGVVQTLGNALAATLPSIAPAITSLTSRVVKTITSWTSEPSAAPLAAKTASVTMPSYVGGASPCDIFKIKQTSCAPTITQQPSGSPGYVDFNAGFSAGYAGAVGVQLNDKARPYVSSGFATPGPILTLMFSPVDATPGCSANFSAIIGVGFNLSIDAHGAVSPEFGIGYRGVSFMMTCTGP